MSKVKNIIILGATSAIAEAYGRAVLNQDTNFLLVGRNKNKIEKIKKDYLARGAKSVKDYILDFSDISNFEIFFDYIRSEFSDINEVLFAYATLPNQEDLFFNSKALQEELTLNVVSPFIILTNIANFLKEKKAGQIIGISSVAGDRGRKANFIYGSTKAALTTYLSGLRNYLYDYNVKVLTVKPGFVDTPMTDGIKKTALFVKPDVIADGIVKAVKSGKDEVYLPWFWKYIMLIIKYIPEFIFKRLSI